jgi:precorrin-4/cobalt-precorrin-4 C11-methyltransferase
LLQHRHASTPVAVVKAAYRNGQSIRLGDLGHLADMPVDMESLVLVGNSQTVMVGGQMVTARGQGMFGAAVRDPERCPETTSEATSAAEQPLHRVCFVGAGPGDPELLTLKGAQALANAAVVVYAGSLVPRGVLQHVRPGARIHNSATLTLEDTHRLLAEAYRAGQRVVRLHSGDPSLYGAITEQMALLDEEHIPYEIVPGVSAFQAVAARLGIEYTQPGVVQTVILTRPGGRTGVPENESLETLARHGVTLCVFLGARHVVQVQQALLTSYPPTTPVAVAYRATWPDEELTVGALADLVEMVQGPEYDRTTLIIVGPSLQRQGKRSHLYDPSYQHLFRPGKRRGSGAVSESNE